jgi:hypothetical protein
VVAPDAVNVKHVPSPNWYILLSVFAVRIVSTAINVITELSPQLVPVNNLFAIIFYL